MDPRALANFILDVADAEGIEVSNLALNKIAYFVHALYLVNIDCPLLDAKIEAWQYGPVFREIYHQFKSCENRPIKRRAEILNPDTGEFEICRYSLSKGDFEFLRSLAMPYIKMRPGALVELSHAPDSPWHKAWHYDGTANPGMEITNRSIKEYFSDQVRH